MATFRPAYTPPSSVATFDRATMGNGVPRRGAANMMAAKGKGCAGDEEEGRPQPKVHPAPHLGAYLGLRRRSGSGDRPRTLSASWPSHFAASKSSPAPVRARGPSPSLCTSCAKFLAEVAIALAISAALLARIARMGHAGLFPFGIAPPLFNGGGAWALNAAAAAVWTTSLALPEAVLCFALGRIGRWLARRAGAEKMISLRVNATVMPPLLLLLAASAFVVVTCTLETATLWYAHRSAPWDLAYDIWNDWAAYRGMAESKTKELGVVLECEVGGAVVVLAGRVGAGWWRRWAERRRSRRKYRVRARWKVLEMDRNQRSSCLRSRRSRVFSVAKRDQLWPRIIVALAFALMVCLRQDEPYSHASGSTYLEALVEIPKSFVEGRKQERIEAKKAQEKLSSPPPSAREISREAAAPPPNPVPAPGTDNDTVSSLKNVVVIFLESARADLLPFDHSTTWAKEKVLPSVVEEASKAAQEGKPNIITPFYSALTRNETSLYLPIKSTSSVSLKSVLATLCGAYPHPSDSTKSERKHGIYQKCLPHLMAQRGASSKFFLPMDSTFDGENILVDKMGFYAEGIYGKEQYNEAHNLTLAKDPCKFIPQRPRRRCLRGPRRIMFEFKHTANYLGYEDNVMLDPVMEWVDNKAATNSPFFLVYETGITHHPFDSPRNWPHTNYSEHKQVDGFLNDVAYTDDFLARFLGGFESRNLAKDTLFVLVGDHGVALGDQDRDHLTGCDWEGAFNVGLTFHTGNPAAAERLRKVAEEHRRLSMKSATSARDASVYSSIDILPTVLDLLDHPDAAASRDGRSLLREPFNGKKLSVSFINPGSDLVLREGNFMCVSTDKGLGRPTLYDLSIDPDQQRPIRLDSKENEDQFSALRRWGEIAARFLRQLRRDLEAAYETGERCDNCTLSVLASSDSLDQWHGIETELA